MKIYVHDQGVTLVGKAWEIRERLKYYGKKHKTFSDWIAFNQQFSKKRSG